MSLKRNAELHSGEAPCEEAHAKAAAMDTWNMRRSFRLLADEIWDTQCPACNSRSFLAGVKYNEEVSEEEDGEDPYEESVDIFYVAEEFLCPSCSLHLDSREALPSCRCRGCRRCR